MKTTTAGGLYALCAYLIWGLAPLFWRQLAERPPLEMLAHRIVWALPFYLGVLWSRGRLGELRRLAHPRTVVVFAVSGLLLSINWFTFVYAVTHAEVLQASLGYFINPILNVVLGMVFLGERLRRGQWWAVALAGGGVGLLATQASDFPWLALLLATSFGLYGLVRKTAPADAILGSNLETAFLWLPALLSMLFLYRSPGSSPPADAGTWILLVLSGAITAGPLLCFSQAARRLTLTTLGFFQYLAPSCQFLLAVWVFGESFTAVELRSFLAIWAALLVFSAESQLHSRRRRQAPIS